MFGLIYRSESLPNSNSRELNTLITTTGLETKFTHKCIVGDFNYRKIDWKATHLCSEGSEEESFIDAVSEGFWHQHVDKPTRARGSDTPNILDLVFTNEVNMINDIQHIAPLGKSDHQILLFDFCCYIDWSEPVEKFNFKKGDYVKAREKFNEFPIPIQKIQLESAN